MGAVEFQGVGWLGQIWVYDIAKREKGGGLGGILKWWDRQYLRSNFEGFSPIL